MDTEVFYTGTFIIIKHSVEIQWLYVKNENLASFNSFNFCFVLKSVG